MHQLAKLLARQHAEPDDALCTVATRRCLLQGVQAGCNLLVQQVTDSSPAGGPTLTPLMNSTKHRGATVVTQEVGLSPGMSCRAAMNRKYMLATLQHTAWQSVRLLTAGVKPSSSCLPKGLLHTRMSCRSSRSWRSCTGQHSEGHFKSWGGVMLLHAGL